MHIYIYYVYYSICTRIYIYIYTCIHAYIYTCIPVKPGTQYTRYRPLPVAEILVKMLPVSGHR